MCSISSTLLNPRVSANSAPTFVAVRLSPCTSLNGQTLTAAQEMGKFCLGSTMVFVFEAPETFEFAVSSGQKVRVGNRLGSVPGAVATVRGVKVWWMIDH